MVKFPWKKFTPGSDVTKISCEGSKTTLKNTATGTTLIIKEISQEWNTRGWNYLKRHLAILSANRGTKRKNYDADKGFTILITAPEFEGGVRDLRTDFLNSGWGTLTAHIDNNHRAVCTLDALGIGRKTITSNMKFLHLQDIQLEIGIMVRERSAMRDKSAASLANLEAILPEWGGVQVNYRNFRVFP